MKFRYEDLDVGEDILEFVDEIHRVSRSFPDDEKYGLTSQIRRASMSIYLNLAEGTARNSKRDFAHFLTIALGSLVESDACMKIAMRRHYIDLQTVQRCRSVTEKIWSKLCALRKSQLL